MTHFTDYYELLPGTWIKRSTRPLKECSFAQVIKLIKVLEEFGLMPDENTGNDPDVLGL